MENSIKKTYQKHSGHQTIEFFTLLFINVKMFFVAVIPFFICLFFKENNAHF